MKVLAGADLRMQSTAAAPAVASWQIGIVIISGLGLAFLVGRAPGALALGAALAFVLVVVFVQRPDIGLLLLLVARASTDASLGSFSTTPDSQQRMMSLLLNPNTALVVILMVAGGLFLLRRGLPVISLPVGAVYALLLVIGLMGVLRADRLLFSLNEWFRAASALFVYALAANLFKSPERIQKVLDTLAGSFVLPAAFGLYQFAVGQGRFLSIGVRRIHGTFVHPNPFAVYLLIMLSVFLCQGLTQSGRRKWISFGIVVVSSVLLVGTYTRSVWVGVGVVLMTIGVLQGRVLLLLVPPIVAVAFRVIPSIGARLEDPLRGSFADRLGIWETLFHQWTYVTGRSQASLAIALDRLTGLGPGSFVPLISESAAVWPHNDYLRVLVESGILGLFLFILLYVLLIRVAYRTWRRSNGSMASIALSSLAVTLAYALISITDNLFANPVNQVYFWALAGIVTAISRIRDGEGAAPPLHASKGRSISPDENGERVGVVTPRPAEA